RNLISSWSVVRQSYVRVSLAISPSESLFPACIFLRVRSVAFISASGEQNRPSEKSIFSAASKFGYPRTLDIGAHPPGRVPIMTFPSPCRTSGCQLPMSASAGREGVGSSVRGRPPFGGDTLDPQYLTC